MVIKLNKFFSIFIFALFFILLCFSKEVVLGVKNGINLSLNILIPSLFPFTVLSVAFIKSGGFYYLSKILGVKFSLWLLSGIGGYPAGALIIKELENTVDESFLKRSVLYSVNAGPSFIIYAVGIAIFNDMRIALYLLISHLFVSFIFCVFSKGINKNTIIKTNNFSLSNIVFSSIEKAGYSILKISATVIFVSAFFEVIKGVSLLEYFSILFEVTLGISKSNKNIYIIAFLLSFSGISVIMQVKMILKNLIDFKRLFTYKILHGCFSVITLKIITFFFPITLETLSNNIGFNNKFSYVSIASSVMLIFMCIIFIVQILSQKNNRENSRLKFNN